MSFYVVLKLSSYFYCIIPYFYRLPEGIIKCDHALVEYLFIKYSGIIKKKPSSYFLIDQLVTY